MKFIFLQDIYSSRYKFILLASLGALLLLILYVLDRRWMLYGVHLLGFIAAIFSVRFLYDDNKKVKWEEYLWTLPIKKSHMVNEKFIFIFIITVILLSVDFLVLMLTKDRWYFGEEVDIDGMVTTNVSLIFFFTSVMFISLMVELISGERDTNIVISLVGFFILLGITVGSLYIIQSYFYTYLLDDIRALAILGGTILVITMVVTYTISLACLKKGREIL